MHEHDDDLRPENIDGDINVYVVEYWTDREIMVHPDDEPCRETQVAGCFSTFDAAMSFCTRNQNYGGVGPHYPSWHWCICRRRLNEHTCNVVSPMEEYWHFKPDGTECTVSGHPLKMEIIGMSDDERCEIDELEDDISSIKEDISKIKEALFKSLSVVIR